MSCGELIVAKRMGLPLEILIIMVSLPMILWVWPL